MNSNDPRSHPGVRYGAKDRDGFFDNPATVNRLCYILYALCALAVLAEFVVHKHGYFDFENWFGFHAWYGFASYCLLIFAAKFLRRLVMRDEDYYGE